MSTQEFWWEFDSKVDQAQRVKDMQKRPGSLYTEAQWKEARKRHTEKMNGGTK